MYSLDPHSRLIPAVNLNGIGEDIGSAGVTPAIVGNVISPVLPLRDSRLELTERNIERISEEVPLLIAETAFKLLGSSGDSSGRPLDLMARSQGGAVGIRAVSSAPETFRRVGLMMPFSLNKPELGTTPAERRHSLLRRLAVSALRSDILDKGNRRSSKEIGQYMIEALKTIACSLRLTPP